MVFILHYRPRGSGLVNQYLQTKRGWGLHLARDFSREISMNTKMKALSLALVGLAGFAGSAMAACPAGPDIAHGGAWTAVNAIGGTATVVTGGYAGTECRLASTLTGDTTSFATVEDDSPTAEPKYRAQFIVGADALTSIGVVDAAYIFSATSSAGPQIQISIVGDGAGGRLVTFIVPDTAAAGGSDVQSFPLTTGENHVEFNLDSSGHVFSVWVNNNVEASPNFTTTTFNNGGATIETAFLGLAGATPGYVSSSSGVAVGFDQFDSRRTLFIGF
jgi:hypothetical protein